MSYITNEQLKDILNGLKGLNPNPEISGTGFYTAGGDRVVSIKPKLYIQDDGGTWDDLNGQPEFIWDMKKISNLQIIDSGSFSSHVNLEPINCGETDEGLSTAKIDKSYLQHANTVTLTMNADSEVVFNLWFKLLEEPTFVQPLAFKLPGIYILISKATNGLWSLTIKHLANFQTQNWTLDTELNNVKVHLLVHTVKNGSNTDVTPMINGQILEKKQLPYRYTSFPSTLEIGKNSSVEIFYISESFKISAFTQTHLNNFFKFGFPLPRAKEYVDLSDELETYGKDLLLNIGTIEKAIENLKGQLFMKTNTIKVKN